MLAASTIVVAVRARGPKVKVAVAARKDLEQRVVASGRVRVPTRVQVAAQVPGLVVAVGAIEGQRVKAGDLLVQIDDAEARAAVSQAKAAVDQANARVEQLRRVGAIVATEALVLADEPTGNLDTESSAEVFALMRRFNRELGTTFLVVTHDPRIAEQCERVIEIVDGRIAGDRA